MKVSEGLKENGIVVGNTYDKYNSKNIIVRRLMSGFDNALCGFVESVAPHSIHEIGCGEGYWVIQWNRKGIKARGSDFSDTVIGIARENASTQGVSPDLFAQKSIYDVVPECDNADLIVCCEVLEHLEHPGKALEALKEVSKGHLIFSVPREPIWCMLNLARGKYISRFGNTPGHIQHWSTKRFVSLINEYFEVIDTKRPFPWTMVLCRAD